MFNCISSLVQSITFVRPVVPNEMNKSHVQSPIEISIRISQFVDEAETLQYHGYGDQNRMDIRRW